MIISKDNSLIKLCTRIKEKKFSKEENLCLVETSKLVSQLYLKKLVTHILVTENKYEQFKNYRDVKVEVISDNIAKHLSDTMTSDGVFAISRIPKKDGIDYRRCLVLDNIQDPSNMGAILRSACAFGFKTILAINSVYPYSYKTIRSSMGYIFDVNFIDITYDELLTIKSNNNISMVVADMDGETLDNFVSSDSNLALIIGNEGQGVSRELRNIADKTYSIPMLNGVESLNASVSAGIIMYLIK